MEKVKILIVEDEPVVAMDIQASLEEMGYLVISMAASGAQAIEEAERERPDLVLMDIQLKDDMTGIEAAQYIYARFDIPIIYLTANCNSQTLEKARVAEPFGYIIKPYEDRELRANIEMALYRDKMEKERRKMAKELQARNERLRISGKLLPICLYCKDIQNKEGHWEKVEYYINRHTDRALSHGVCPECAREHYPHRNWDVADE
jgi:CheY-like chemotaxis protein